MRTLIYKRTHTGDPDDGGRFGIHDCMGKVRGRNFDAVIGVGGIGAEPKSYGLAEKVNWVGIGPHRTEDPDKRGPVVTFEKFKLFESDGPNFRDLAPNLAERMYSRNVRTVMDSLDKVEQKEVRGILKLAKHAPSSAAGGAGAMSTAKKCAPRIRSGRAIKGCSC